MAVDPTVSRRKFEREAAAARAYGPFRRQGVWIIRAEYPVVFAILAVNKPFPVLPGILCGLHLDFSNYDVSPPSIRLVDPFDETPLVFSKCWPFPKANLRQDPETPQQNVTEVLNLLQFFDPAKPFFCIPGVREYHECSAHTGDSWFHHRKPNLLIHLLMILKQHVPNLLQVQVNHQMFYKVSS